MSLLRIPEIHEDPTKEQGTFFDFKQKFSGNPLTLLASHKGYIYGILLKHEHRLKQSREQETKELVLKLQTLEICHKNTGASPQLDVETAALRQCLHNFSLLKTKVCLHVTGVSFTSMETSVAEL